MDFKKLKDNMMDVVMEEQIKLGYREETIHLYYPLLSLNRFLSSDFDIHQMNSVLKDFCIFVLDEFGRVEVSNRGERFCFKLPPKVSRYVHDQINDNPFLFDFIQTIEKHNITIDDILQVFHKYSDCVHFERVTHGEFDYLIYFEDGKPDSFRYCITDEGVHFIYHRFTVEDYLDFEFEP